jgi:hypothetical protein
MTHMERVEVAGGADDLEWPLTHKSPSVKICHLQETPNNQCPRKAIRHFPRTTSL